MGQGSCAELQLTTAKICWWDIMGQGREQHSICREWEGVDVRENDMMGLVERERSAWARAAQHPRRMGEGGCVRE